MDAHVFSGPAQVQIPNGKLLDLLDRQLYFAAYELKGFDEDVMLIDCRQDGQRAADDYLQRRDRAALAQALSRPARVEIWRLGPDQVLVELEETVETAAGTTLWLGTAAGKARRSSDAIFYQERPITRRRKAILSLHAS